MKRKLIIHIEDDNITEIEALIMIAKVVEMGRVSLARGRKQFCFVAAFDYDGKKIEVVALEKNNQPTDTFKVRLKK